MDNLLPTGLLMAALTSLLMIVGYWIGGTNGTLVAFLIAAATNVWSFWNADTAVLSWYNAQPVDARQAPALVRLVDSLAARAGLPPPKVYIINSDQPNAFATGRDPAHAAVAVNTGLLQVLSEPELAGVLAHELTHVRNRDTLTMTITATLAGAIGTLANLGMFMRPTRGDGRNGGVGAIGALLIMVLAPLTATLVQLAISRTREFSADRGSAEITGQPLALASALRKIDGIARQVPNAGAERNPATAHLFIVNPLAGVNFDSLFATHPSVEQRVARLQAMA